jgi:hypothetical protein
LAGMGARDFVVADTDLSFTRVHNNPKRVPFGNDLDPAAEFQGDLLWPDCTRIIPCARTGD